MDRKICVFGDSIVQASYVKNNWTVLLRSYFEEKYTEDDVAVYSLGVGGNTTDDLLGRFEAEAGARDPSILIFQIGTNDSGYFRVVEKPITKEDKFASNLIKLIQKAKEFTNDIIFLGLTIGDDSLTQPLPSSSRGKSYVKERIKKYDEILKKTVLENGCKYVSLEGGLIFQDFSDGLHPNEEGHKKIFDEVKKSF